MKKAFKLALFISMLLPAIGFGQKFNDEMSILLSPTLKDFNSIKGDFISTDNQSGISQYKCTQTLDGFNTYICLVANNSPLFIAHSSGPNADLNVAMFIMLPPTGFDRYDSQTDKSIVLKDDVKRKVNLISYDKRTIVSITFWKKDTYSMSITKDFK